jgi:hypothetical protein
MDLSDSRQANSPKCPNEKEYMMNWQFCIFLGLGVWFFGQGAWMSWRKKDLIPMMLGKITWLCCFILAKLMTM